MPSCSSASAGGSRSPRAAGQYYSAVHAALGDLRDVGGKLRANGTASLTIGCTQEISTLLLVPLFSRLRCALGKGVAIRILNCDYDTLPLVAPAGVDIVFDYASRRDDSDSVRILDEEIVPVASPAFAKRVARTVARHPRHWADLPRLELTDQRNPGWATWTTWFGAHDSAVPAPPVEVFEHYLHVLEAAANGDGIALGWNGFMGEYFRTDRLVPLGREWLATGIGLYSVRARPVREEPGVERCLEVLPALVRTLTSSPPVSERARRS